MDTLGLVHVTKHTNGIKKYNILGVNCINTYN